VVQGAEVLLPGKLQLDCDLGLPAPSVSAAMAEAVLLTMEGRLEGFSLSRELSADKVTQIHQLGERHGATLAAIRGPSGPITDEDVARCRKLALASRAAAGAK
jgi:fatty aldehyde-generating acyl-ACP reductase